MNAEASERGVLHTLVGRLERDDAPHAVEDVSAAVARVLGAKDERERGLMASAASATSHLFKRLLRKPMEVSLLLSVGSAIVFCSPKNSIAGLQNALEEEDDARIPTHAALAEKAESILHSPDLLAKQKLPQGADDANAIEACYTPCIQVWTNPYLLC